MLHLLHHSLGTHVVTHLRDRTTKPATFRTLAYQISLLLAFEVTRNLATRRRRQGRIADVRVKRTALYPLPAIRTIS
jgi:uracil phosphoribosyltransferase